MVLAIGNGTGCSKRCASFSFYSVAYGSQGQGSTSFAWMNTARGISKGPRTGGEEFAKY